MAPAEGTLSVHLPAIELDEARSELAYSFILKQRKPIRCALSSARSKWHARMRRIGARGQLFSGAETHAPYALERVQREGGGGLRGDSGEAGRRRRRTEHLVDARVVREAQKRRGLPDLHAAATAGIADRSADAAMTRFPRGVTCPVQTTRIAVHCGNSRTGRHKCNNGAQSAAAVASVCPIPPRLPSLHRPTSTLDDESRYEQAYRRDVAQADLKCILVPVHHVQRRLDARNVPVDVRDLHSSERDLLRRPTAQLLMG